MSEKVPRIGSVDGKKIHVLRSMGKKPNGFEMLEPACGNKSRAYAYETPGAEVTCEKCLVKMMGGTA